uniref:Pif-4 n=1 Tax=Malacosoma sp. alphabaculovirus TaxID=1881632 RepID=A0A1B1V5I5_9ABAC|nr:pif-4 [Malacosoma sp. alphabaculovirus]
MLAKTWSVLILLIAILSLLVFLVTLLFLNPYRNAAEKLIHDHAYTLQFGAYIDIYDLTTNATVERLFVIRPENVVLYNLNGALFHYLNTSNLMCPHEFSLARFTRAEIDTINDDNLYTVVCTNVSALTVLEHFVTLKNNIVSHRIILDPDTINYSVLDIINLLIYGGFVHIK